MILAMRDIGNNAFGSHLKWLRKENRLSLKRLADRAELHRPNLVAMESGRVVVGQTVAKRLADGLRLRGADRDQFLLMAAQSSNRDRIVQANGEFPAWSFNLLPEFLRRAGVSPHDDAGLQVWQARFTAILDRFDAAIASGDLKLAEAAYEVAKQFIGRGDSKAPLRVDGQKTPGRPLAHHSNIDVTRVELIEWMNTLLEEAHIDVQSISELGQIETDHRYPNLWTVCAACAKRQPLLPEIAAQIESRGDRSHSLVIFLDRRRQALVDCQVKVFECETKKGGK